MTRRPFLLGVGLLAVLLAGLALPASAGAADPPARLEIEAQPREGSDWMLVATLTSGGAPLSQATVAFFQQVDFFGERWVPLGSSVTDAAGVASRLYSPTSNGDQLVVARYQGELGSAQSEPAAITVSGAIPFHPPDERLLPIVRSLAFPVGLAVLVLVWLALVGILLRTVVGIVREAPAGQMAARRARPAGFDRVTRDRLPSPIPERSSDRPNDSKE